ncbi:MAG: carboxylesterase family protein, partial [Propionibacteriaceae bacterium]|nr:carboxylesterase family protein [Propionibacteriaceae bacterium]
PLDSREGVAHRRAALLPADPTGNARAKVAELYADQLAADPQQAWDAICTHHDWTAPAHRFAADASNGSGLVFSYEFARPSDALCGKVGAAHLIEVPYAFGNLAAAGAADLLGATSQTEEAQRLSEAMNGYWAAFIATGNPATVGVPSWPAYSAAERTVMVFDSAAHPVRHHLAPQVDFWTECVDISTPPLTAVGIQ